MSQVLGEQGLHRSGDQTGAGVCRAPAPMPPRMDLLFSTELCCSSGPSPARGSVTTALAVPEEGVLPGDHGPRLHWGRCSVGCDASSVTRHRGPGSQLNPTNARSATSLRLRRDQDFPRQGEVRGHSHGREGSAVTPPPTSSHHISPQTPDPQTCPNHQLLL